MFFQVPVDGELAVGMLKVSIAKMFHWTLDYIDSLTLGELMMLQGVVEGQTEYEHKMSKGG